MKKIFTSLFLLCLACSLVQGQTGVIHVYKGGDVAFTIPYAPIDSFTFQTVERPVLTANEDILIQGVARDLGNLSYHLGEPAGTLGNSGYANDFGYPAVALTLDLNSGDMTNIVTEYDWFSPSLEWSERAPGYVIPHIRCGLFFSIIESANIIIAKIPANTNNTTLKAQRGQAKAWRAFGYLSLAPYFQFNYADNKAKPSVPILDNDARNYPRATQAEVYQLILADLTDAIADLEGFVRANKGEIDQHVAYGLRARANLYMENWSAAAADAEKALQGYTPYTYAEIQANPRFNNVADHSWIWGAIIPQDMVGSSIISWPSHLSSFSSGGYTSYAGIYRQINKLLWDKIPTTDVRRAWWLNEDNYSPYLKDLTWMDGAVAYTDSAIASLTIPDIKQPFVPYTNVKFMGQAGPGGSTNEGDWCLMRAEEMILIRAEALARDGNEAAGKQVLAALMAERNPQYQQTCPNFVNEVWLQRRIELWGEGFAMADIMRLKKNVVRYHTGEATNVPSSYQFNVAYGDPWILWRFSNTIMNNYAGIEQNEGGQQPKQGDGAGLLDGVTD